ncbi:hypothetical protein CAI16_18875 [Virgibacillus dokdonensis]|uniref:SIS domain-containing protein n=1 Tax=Virgibacillus dokdonensis TaxID=302167 RepID=A0A3E0WGT0_9BACI|nr:SIS domain-containing protein [Virgibacillus dokdonensis]RFA32190.1 hypothetical protein CAI16_18875 [Virgibacillus dokdonensis]
MCNRLDNADLINVIDPSNMLQTIQRLDEQLEETLSLSESVEIKFNSNEINNIVFAGVGGSAIGGSLIVNYIKNICKMPAIIHRNYNLPSFVDVNTLVFITSNSGNTREQLKIYDEAKSKEAKIVVITGGGKLLERAKNDNCTLFYYEGRTSIAPTARASICHMFFSILNILQKIDFIPCQKKELQMQLPL